MKYIQKRSEPQKFTQWKSVQKSIGVNCDYPSLQNPEKGLVHNSLLHEQGYICCYCCMRIVKDTSHIEHLDPQSETDADLSIDYNNLLASCGSSNHWPKHCGNKKKNSSIEVSPLQANCEGYFSYYSNGQIVPASDLQQPEADKSRRTIDILGPNDYDLTQGRINALESLKGLTNDQAKKFAQICLQRNAQEQYQPFCTAVLYYLKQYFGIQP
jgi:uncharacterized protein (TIGR02646 family)